MRRVWLLAVVVGSVAACANEVTAPAVQPVPESSVTAVDGSGMGRWGSGRRGFGLSGALFAARRLPDNLKLSDGQRAQIKSLVASFRTAHRDDLKALAASMKQARAARVAGQTVDQRRALFAQTAPARQRLTAANKQLRTDIEQVLTADQRSWLAAHHPTFRRQHSRA